MIHRRSAVRDVLLDSVYASPDSSVALPKYQMPADEHQATDIERLVAAELLLEGNSRQNLPPFFHTRGETQVAEIMQVSIHKNMVDKDEYPQTAELASR